MDKQRLVAQFNFYLRFIKYASLCLLTYKYLLLRGSASKYEF